MEQNGGERKIRSVTVAILMTLTTKAFTTLYSDTIVAAVRASEPIVYENNYPDLTQVYDNSG